MCDLLLKTIYDKHQEYLSDLSIGYPLSRKRNRQLEDLIHVYHLLSSSELTNNDILSILNYYNEY
jgi:hypothetical protein